jgi:phage recombination protein Bet
MTDAALAVSTTNVDPDVAAAVRIYERLRPLADALGLDRLTPAEMQLFAMVAHHTGLDPFTRQIYAIKRGGKVTHQTGIDGYRSIAERTGQYGGHDEPTFEACDCGRPDSPPEHPRLARVVVHRLHPSGHVVHQTGVARWHELKPEHTKPQGAFDYLDAMWWRMPYNQLAKCAEAKALRIAFPRVLGEVYISEEMEQARVVEGEARPVPPAPAAADRLAERRARLELEATERDEPPGQPAVALEEPEPAACGAPSQHTDDQVCILPAGHEKNHRSANGETWGR